jgi:hypothetical protein
MATPGRARAVITGRHWAWATALALVVIVVEVLMRFDNSNYWAGQRILRHGPWYLLFAYIFVFAIAWVESMPDDRAPGLWRYALAAFAAGLLCLGLVGSLARYVEQPVTHRGGGLARPPPKGVSWETRRRVVAVVDPGLDGAMLGFLATMIYARLRKCTAHDAHLGTSGARAVRGEPRPSRRDAGGSRSAVDPARVIERLDAIARLYEEDSDAADAQLDELIDMLRESDPPRSAGIRDPGLTQTGKSRLACRPLATCAMSPHGDAVHSPTPSS